MVLKKPSYLKLAPWQWCWLLLAVPLVTRGQEALPVTELQPVEIVSEHLSPFAIGARGTGFDSLLLSQEAVPNLVDIIANYTSLAIKSYGNGMLATISFRGTGPGHTAVLWHGINITYPMLGQSDLSLLSLGLSDQVMLQYGTGSALYGSGALGGTVSLTNTTPAQGTDISLSQWFGSFGTVKNNLRASYANDKFFLQVKTLWDQSANNFRFTNTTKPGLPVERQQGADYSLMGAAFEAGLEAGKSSRLLLSGQYFMADRNLQPSMNANTATDNQTDENIRLRAKYAYQHGGYTGNLNYAYLLDVIGFNGAKTLSDQQVLRAESEWRVSSWLNLNVAGDYNYISIKSPFYAAAQTTENRANLWAAFLLSPLERLAVSLNLRQSFNTDYAIPFTPSLGLEYSLVDKPGSNLVVKSLLARGYRVPTLNDRFWQPGGNPDLQPEDSWSAEIGLSGQANKKLPVTYELTAYRMWVDNWILWRPQGSFWSPANVKYVDVYGLEVAGTLAHRWGAADLRWQGNYALTKSINRTGLDAYDRSVNKQLAYVPVHKASLTATTGIAHWAILINAAFTGKRYVTADNENDLPAYTLVNFRVSRAFSAGNFRFSGHANVNNLLNTQYQSIENRAMPGINFLLGITISYHKP